MSSLMWLNSPLGVEQESQETSLVAYRLHPEVVARAETTGGLLFHRLTGTRIELDAEAWRALMDGSITKTAQGHAVAEQLIAGGFIIPTIGETGPIDPGPRDTPPEHQTEALSAPETVHIAITDLCNLHCSFCYADTQGRAGFMPLDLIKRLIDEMAEMRVFELAIGGGEPFLHPNIVEIVRYAREKGVVPNVTTNGKRLDDSILAKVQPHIGRLQLSLDDHRPAVFDGMRGRGAFAGVKRAASIAQHLGLPFGINSLLTRENIRYVVARILLAEAWGALQITLLRPKPGFGNPADGLRLAPTPEQWRWLRGVLLRAAERHTRIAIQVDCAASFLFRGVPPEVLRSRGVFGCTAGGRILSVKADGCIYPCSHLAREPFYAGRIGEKPLKEIWDQSPAFDRFRDYRRKVGSDCGSCQILDHCGSCPAVAYAEVLQRNIPYHPRFETHCPRRDQNEDTKPS